MKRKRRPRAAPPRVMLIAWVLPKTYDTFEEVAATVQRARPQLAKRLDLEKEDVAGRMLDRFARGLVAKVEEELARTSVRGRRTNPRRKT